MDLFGTGERGEYEKKNVVLMGTVRRNKNWQVKRVWAFWLQNFSFFVQVGSRTHEDGTSYNTEGLILGKLQVMFWGVIASVWTCRKGAI